MVKHFLRKYTALGCQKVLDSVNTRISETAGRTEMQKESF